jgi:acyl-CoA thioester hydrolase
VSREPAAFGLALEATAADADALGHVNNVICVHRVLEAAGAHWRALATPEEQASRVRVAVRHEIDHARPCYPGDRIVVRTWVGRREGLAFERHTEILRAAGRSRLALARTPWCPLDAATPRPVRAPAGVRARFAVADDPPAS